MTTSRSTTPRIPFTTDFCGEPPPRPTRSKATTLTATSGFSSTSSPPCSSSHRSTPAVIVIAGVERWLDEQGGLDVLENPEVAVNVVAFDLVGRGGGSPQKSVVKGIRGVVLREVVMRRHF